MKKVKLAKAPKSRSADYEIAGKKFARVVYKPVESGGDRITLHAQAFEVDAKGQLVAYETGEPSRTPGTTHVISVSGIGDTHTIDPGWVRVVGTFDPKAAEGQPNAAPAGTKKLSKLPETGKVGDYVFIGDTLHRWDNGVLASILEGKAEELQRILGASKTLQSFTI